MTGGHWHGRWDMVVGSVTPTKARARVVDFAGVYYYSPYVFAVHKTSPARNWQDLNNKKIRVETGTTSEGAYPSQRWRSTRRTLRRSNMWSRRA